MAAVHEHEFDVGFDEGFELEGGGVLSVDFFDDVGVGGFKEAADALFEEFVFVFEVVGDDACADACAFGDFSDGGLGESVLGDGFDGCIDDLFSTDFFDESWFFGFYGHFHLNLCLTF